MNWKTKRSCSTITSRVNKSK